MHRVSAELIYASVTILCCYTYIKTSYLIKLCTFHANNKSSEASCSLELWRVQRQTAHWSCGSQWNPVTLSWTKSSETCLSDLSWPTLYLHRHYLSIVALYDILHAQKPSSNFHWILHYMRNLQLYKETCFYYCIYSVNLQCISILFYCKHLFLWNSIP